MKRIEVHQGERYGRLCVIEEVSPVRLPSRLHRQVRCLCDCGVGVIVRLDRLRVGDTKSCGCLFRDESTRPGRGATHGLYKHPLYKTWADMRNRCTKPRNKRFASYGGRGITIYPDWLSNPTNFIEYIGHQLGPRPEGMTLDRINNDGGYEPGNLRWATRSEQNANRRGWAKPKED